jgi:hypothetical protein
MHSTALTLLAAAHVNALRPSLFRKAPQPIQTDANTFTEDDGYKLLAGHREKRWSLAWASQSTKAAKAGQAGVSQARRVLLEPERDVLWLDGRRSK